MQKGFTLWLTGLTGSGKTTLANEVEGLLLERGVPVEVLDDEEVRLRLYPELGYAKEDRDLNVERLAYLARILSRNGVVAIVAAVSPYHDARRQARQSTERFVEVYCKCPVDVLRKRDMKKIYARADIGEISNLSGVSGPYEEPEKPEVVVETHQESVEESASRIVKTLEVLNLAPSVEGGNDYSEAEEAEIRDRLAALGYL